MSEAPELEQNVKNPGGRTNLKRDVESHPDNAETKATDLASIESPQGNQMRNIGKTDKVGTA